MLDCPAAVGMRQGDDRHDPKTTAIGHNAGIGRLHAVEQARPGQARKPLNDIPAYARRPARTASGTIELNPLRRACSRRNRVRPPVTKTRSVVAEQASTADGAAPSKVELFHPEAKAGKGPLGGADPRLAVKAVGRRGDNGGRGRPSRELLQAGPESPRP